MNQTSPEAQSPAETIVDEGRKQLEQSAFVPAALAFQQATQTDPNYSDGWYYLAIALTHMQKHRDAIQVIQKAIELAPEEAEYYNHFGNILHESGRMVEAGKQYKKATQLQPERGYYYANLSAVLVQMQRFANALKAALRAIELDEACISAYCNAAIAHAALGNTAQQESCAMQALALKPDCGMAFHQLAKSKTWDKWDASCRKMQEHWANADTHVADKVYLGYALGKICEDLKKYDKAFAFFRKANDLKRQSIAYDAYQSKSYASRLIDYFSKERMARQSDAGYDDAPVFVLGLPRSGTTLVEHILSSHSHIHGMGERDYIPQIISSLEREIRLPFPDLLSVVSDEQKRTLGQQYGAKIREGIPETTTKIIDKLPGNFLYIGLIKTILPGAKIIYCTRDSEDNGMAIYKKMFEQSVPYASNLYEIGHMISAERKLHAHWQEEALSDTDMLTISYEALVKNPETTTKEMLSFLGLEWEEACQAFHESDRPVATPSAAQVRQPIYTSAINSAQYYSEHLSLLRAGMEDGKVDL